MNPVQFSIGIALAATVLGLHASQAKADLQIPIFPVETSSACTDAAAREERERDIPNLLLRALALAESGRRDDETRQMIAWPWTVMAEGVGRYYATKEAAIAVVRDLQKRGVHNIDVGCMQINLMHHPEAFKTLDEAFDPEANVAYGAHFLVALKRESGAWLSAVRRYHSAHPERNQPYHMRVVSIWRNEKRLAATTNGYRTAGSDLTTEVMSTTIGHRLVDLAKLPEKAASESRAVRWQVAFRKTETALSGLRAAATAVDRPRPDGINAVSRRVHAALSLLKRTVSSP